MISDILGTIVDAIFFIIKMVRKYWFHALMVASVVMLLILGARGVTYFTGGQYQKDKEMKEYHNKVEQEEKDLAAFKEEMEKLPTPTDVKFFENGKLATNRFEFYKIEGRYEGAPKGDYITIFPPHKEMGLDNEYTGNERKELKLGETIKLNDLVKTTPEASNLSELSYQIIIMTKDRVAEIPRSEEEIKRGVERRYHDVFAKFSPDIADIDNKKQELKIRFNTIEGTVAGELTTYDFLVGVYTPDDREMPKDVLMYRVVVNDLRQITSIDLTFPDFPNYKEGDVLEAKLGDLIYYKAATTYSDGHKTDYPFSSEESEKLGAESDIKNNRTGSRTCYLSNFYHDNNGKKGIDATDCFRIYDKNGMNAGKRIGPNFFGAYVAGEYIVELEINDTDISGGNSFTKQVRVKFVE